MALNKSKGVPRAGRISKEKRWAMIREAQGFKTGGLSDSQIVDELRKANAGISKPHARRILTLMYADFDRDAARRRKGQLGAHLAGLDRSKRIALTAQRTVIVNGTVQKVPEPDGKLYLSTLEAEAKLLGLNAPERREVLVTAFDVAFADVVSALREEIVDPLPPARELLLRLSRRIRMAMEAGVRNAKGGIVDAAVLSSSTTPLSKKEELGCSVNFASQSGHGSNGVAK